MSLRGKILALLSAIALVPALITASLDSQRLHGLSADLTERNARAMADQALVNMQRVASEYALLLDRETRRIRVLVELQAEYAERLLREAASQPANTGAEIFFSEQFTAEDPVLELEAARSAQSQAHHKALPLSWRYQVFHHMPALARGTLLSSARALLPMTDFYRKVRDRDDHILRWQYVVLENGLGATYPGHGNYPDDFNARARPWYVAQKQDPRFRWYRPHFDAASGALVINATMPLFDPAGAFLGITGIDIDLTATFAALALPHYLREGSEIMQVATVSSPQAPNARLVVLARQSATVADGSWRALPDLESFALGDRATNRRLADAMLAHRSGHLRATVDGRDCFVLYQPFGRESAYIVMTVPVATATRAALEAAAYAKQATADHVNTLLKFLLAASTLVLLVALIASRHLTRPIEQLRDALERLAKGDFTVRAALHTGDELQTLGDAFDTMVPQLEDHARVGESLGLARSIQQKLLPAAAPKVAGYDLAGLSIYSEQTGGDYFDYVPLDTRQGRRYGVVVADVSGHGIGPSLLMATTRALLHGGQGRGLSLGELIGFVNNHLADDVTMGHFVTLFLLAIDADNSALEWVTAGHDPALHFAAASGTISELGGDDIPLGIDADWQFSANGGTNLAHGDIVVMGTDGIWDTISEQGERFGKQRIRDFIIGHAAEDAAQLCAGLKDRLRRFRGQQTQRDDLTIVVVKRIAAAA